MKKTHKLAMHCIGILASVAVLGGAASSARADTYPSRTVTIVVGSEPGGAPDLIARVIGTHLGERLARTVIVENRAGATGTVAAAYVARAQPDGYTLSLGTVSSHAIAKSVFAGLSYDPVTSFVPVGQVASVPLILVVRTDSKARTLDELGALARAQAGKLNYASAGQGGPQHLASELFTAATGSQITHIPYKSGSAGVTAVLAGHVDLFFAGMPPALAQINAGKLRALAVTTAARFPAAPEVPTAMEAGLPGFEADNWHALFAPAGTPETVVARLNKELGIVLQDPQVVAQLLKIGAVAKGGSPADLARLAATDSEKWARVAKRTGIAVN
jgi:tripartite-type tricarboxylate transporter receptor subunit TctC